jgi:hypothetical protein
MRAEEITMKKTPKDKPIFVRATAEEHALFTKQANKRHTTLSELVRQLLYKDVASK